MQTGGKTCAAARRSHCASEDRELQGLAEPVAEDKRAVAAGLAAHLRKVPSDTRYYGVTFDDHGIPKQLEEVEKAGADGGDDPHPAMLIRHMWAKECAFTRSYERE